ncbi:MAG TPA: dipeptide ABC transporter ATP-binding protein [Bradyrhizobium sp.]|nr:dipeptide ABC transporter ATP-binding protein [Bradyrhizobium sp.]
MSDALPQAPGEPLLRVEDLKVHFPVTKGIIFQRQVATVKAVDGVSFTIRRGETLGLVGESGSGKSTTGLAVLRMLTPTAGRIVFEGQDIAPHRGAELLDVRRRMQMVYQDPYGSLNPRMTIRSIVGEPLAVHGLDADRKATREKIAELIASVGLLPDMADRYPHEFSGGQRQRIGIARALALEPSLLIADEPVSALDVSIQAQVINLFMDLQERLGLTYLFIAHDLAVVRHISTRIAVMYLGRLVEIADRDELYKNPLHPYTEALMAAVPVADPEVEAKRPRTVISGEVPSALRPPPGCAFHTRCPRVMARCKTEQPQLREAAPGRAVACHLHD